MTIFYHTHPKITGSTFSFPEFLKKMTLFHLPIFEPVTRLATPILDHAWSCINMHKISLYIPSVHSSNTVHFWVPWPDCSHSFLTMLSPNIFIHLLICVKLYQQAKNQLVSLALSQSLLESRYQIGHTFFYHALPKTFQSTFNFCKFVWRWNEIKKWGCFIDLLWRNAWFKNLAIWMAESILAYISGPTFFPNRRFVQEHSK